MKTFNFLATTIILSTTLVACKKDKENPTISISTPAEHTTFNWGETVHIEAEFEDDRALKSYSVMMGDEEGNHDHDFDFMISEDIDGMSYHFHEHFMVPDSVAMMAWLHFTVVDAEDKSTSQKWMLHFEE